MSQTRLADYLHEKLKDCDPLTRQKVTQNIEDGLGDFVKGRADEILNLIDQDGQNALRTEYDKAVAAIPQGAWRKLNEVKKAFRLRGLEVY